MDDSSAHREIVALETRIEELGDTLATCAKFILASRIAVAGGAVVFGATLVGAMPFNPTVFLAAIAAMIGGIVLLGSNKSTADQARAALQEAEARRVALIAEINPRIVGETVH